MIFKKGLLNVILFYLITFLFLTLSLKANEVKILLKINEEIITNVDVENEYNYLTSLNTSLKDINQSQVLLFAKNSLIKEIIKKSEISKYYELEKQNETVDMMIKTIYKNLGVNSEAEFKKYLNENNLKFNDVYKKIEIEAVWNQMIYQKFRDKIFIDEKKIKEKILNNPKKIENLLLSEIVVNFENKNEIQNIYNQIINSIKNIGFKETVIKFSISNSKTKSGSIGWVNKNSLSKNILNELKNIKVGQITKPILISSGILILKLDNKKIEEQNVDLEFEMNKMIDYEMNTQLDNLSTIYFNKIKNNLPINEY